MDDSITFTLDGREVSARARREHLGGGEARWHPASRTSATPTRRATAPTATAAPAWSRSRASGCWRPPASARRRPGMVVRTASERAVKARAMVIELLLADQPARAAAHDRSSHFWDMADAAAASRRAASRRGRRRGAAPRRQPRGDAGQPRRLHPLQPLRPRLPRGAGQRRDRHGRARPRRADRLRHGRSDGRLDLRRLRRMRAGLPDRRADGGERARRRGARRQRATSTREVRSVCPYCGVGCQIAYKIRDGRIAWVDGVDGPANENRLCVKGRFGFDYVAHPHRLTRAADPPRRRAGEGAERRSGEPAGRISARRRWDEALDAAAAGLDRSARAARRRGGRRVRQRQVLERGGVSLPEADPPGLRAQQRRPLHPALPRLVGGGADGERRLGARSPRPSTRSRTPMSPSSSAPTRPRTTRWRRPTSSSSPSAAAS